MLALHALVAAVVVVLASLGAWQLRRLDEATARAATVEARLSLDPVPVTELLDGLGSPGPSRLAELEFRPVVATGTWVVEDEVLQRGRSYEGRAGLGVLTPLRLEDGSILLVRRGTVPFESDLRPPVAAAAPPTGTITVEGTLERSVPQPESGLAQRDPDEGELAIVFNADVDRLAPQLDGPLRPMLLRAAGNTSGGDLLRPVPPPSPDRGPHLSYAVQWFSFATIGAVMYALWLVRRARGDERARSREAV